MNEVIQYLEHVQEITSSDIATFRKELDGHQSIDPNFVRHTNELLAKAQHEHECLEVVIAMLKDELGWEEEAEWEEEADAMLADMGVVNEAEIDECLAAIRKRRDEACEAMKGGV